MNLLERFKLAREKATAEGEAHFSKPIGECADPECPGGEVTGEL